MARRRRPRKTSWTRVLLTLAVLVVGGIETWHRTQERNRPRVSQPPAKPARSLTSIRDGRLQDGPNNDGDSFLVAHGADEVHEFRLYFVDCAEKRHIKFNAQRLKEQGDYFGGLDETQTVEVGLMAKAFTEELMLSQPFAVHTKWQRVFDSQRSYAFVTFDDGEDLSAKLVRAGLARIYTSGATLPDGTRESTYKAHLRALEAEAKEHRRGAWGMQP